MDKEGESKRDKRFLTMAAGVALTSKARMKHGAVLVRHGKVLAVSPNIPRNHPAIVSEEHLDRCSTHAEEAVLKKTKYPKNTVLYVSRVNRFGELRNSKPCLRCQQLIDTFGCRVVHT